MVLLVIVWRDIVSFRGKLTDPPFIRVHAPFFSTHDCASRNVIAKNTEKVAGFGSARHIAPQHEISVVGFPRVSYCT
ncbi:MAG: hypothetical protein A4E20_08105 [Nitrospira sp. SG-bin2]|nr:MAG: hypothetical protein A4E20_08105 [Nitrospira sp. SG-bin2]